MLRLFTAIPYFWLLVLFLVPFAIVAKISVSDYAISIPPYTPTLDLSEGWAGVKAFFAALDFENFVFLTEDELYWKAYLSSLQIAVISTFLTLCVGFPIAYGMARAPEDWRPALMMLVIAAAGVAGDAGAGGDAGWRSLATLATRWRSLVLLSVRRRRSREKAKPAVVRLPSLLLESEKKGEGKLDQRDRIG